MQTNLSLCARCVDRLRQLVGLYQSFWQLNAAYGAVLLIACPAASCNISAHDALDRKHLKLPAHHAVSLKTFLPEKFRHIFYVHGNHVVRHDIFGVIEPELRHLGKNCALLCDLIL